MEFDPSKVRDELTLGIRVLNMLKYLAENNDHRYFEIVDLVSDEINFIYL